MRFLEAYSWPSRSETLRLPDDHLCKRLLSVRVHTEMGLPNLDERVLHSVSVVSAVVTRRTWIRTIER